MLKQRLQLQSERRKGLLLPKIGEFLRGDNCSSVEEKKVKKLILLRIFGQLGQMDVRPALLLEQERQEQGSAAAAGSLSEALGIVGADGSGSGRGGILPADLVQFARGCVFDGKQDDVAYPAPW